MKLKSHCEECARLSELYWAAYADEVAAEGEFKLTSKAVQTLQEEKRRAMTEAKKRTRAVGAWKDSHRATHARDVEEPAFALDPGSQNP